MTPLALITLARAHPPSGIALAADAHERLADEVVLGPAGCFVADATVRWEHHSGAFVTRGEADTTWRFDDRAWRLDRFEPGIVDDDSRDVRIAPLLFGVSVRTDLHYPTTPNRIVDWPSPSATLPTRLFGEIESVSIDELTDGSKRVVQAFDWDGWKRVQGERRVTFDADSPGVATAVELDALDRWPNGCSVRSVGTATLGARGLPVTEIWRFEGNCPLRDWTGEWTFAFGDWERCPSTVLP